MNTRAHAVWVVVIAAGLLDAHLSAGVLQLVLDPPRLQVTTFSGAQRVRITATVDPDARPIVVVRGPDADIALNRRARVGLLWLSSGVVHISGAPAIFMCYCSEPIERLLAPAEIDRHGLDAGALGRRMRVAPAAADRPDIRDAYIALRRDDGSYRFVDSGDGALRPGVTPGSYSTVIPWLPTARPATYEVTVYACRLNRVAQVSTTAFEVVREGPTLWLATTAVRRPLFYGAIAVTVALSVGFGVDSAATLLRRRRARRAARRQREVREVH